MFMPSAGMPLLLVQASQDAEYSVNTFLFTRWIASGMAEVV